MSGKFGQKDFPLKDEQLLSCIDKDTQATKLPNRPTAVDGEFGESFNSFEICSGVILGSNPSSRSFANRLTVELTTQVTTKTRANDPFSAEAQKERRGGDWQTELRGNVAGGRTQSHQQSDLGLARG